MRVRLSHQSSVEFYAYREPPPNSPVSARSHQLNDDASSLLTPISDSDSIALARLTRECSALRLRLATAERRERRTYRGPPTAPPSARTPPSATLDIALESAYAHRDAARSHLQTEVMKLAERYKALERTLREMQESLRAKDKEIEDLRRERDRLIVERDLVRGERDQARADRDDEVKKNRALTREITSLQNQLAVEKQQRSRSRSRAPTRRAEAPPPPPPPPLPTTGTKLTVDAECIARARSMDVFLTKTDGWSGAQVIQAVEDLNTEINHFAASAVETCVFAKRMKPRASMADPGQSLEEENAPWLGPAFSKLIATKDHAQDPILVQLALQASIVICCARSMSLFCVGFPSKLDALLSRVLTNMQSSEPQATSARWRALTHRAIRMLYPGLEEYAVTELVATMLRWSSTVFSLAGSTASPEPSSALVLSAQLRRIAEAVYKLAKVTREEILSTTFEVVVVDGGDAFEEARMTNKMRDYEDYLADDNASAAGRSSASGNGAGKTSSAQSGKVLCTTELGLRCVTRTANRGSTTGPEECADSELFETRLLLQPKVVLNSALEAIERA